jgi:hypothetical protein
VRFVCCIVENGDGEEVWRFGDDGVSATAAAA